jgi:hypothetical protein
LEFPNCLAIIIINYTPATSLVPDSRSQVAGIHISSSVEKNLGWIAFLYFFQDLFCYLPEPLFSSKSPRFFM